MSEEEPEQGSAEEEFQPPETTMASFLENHPPGSPASIADLAVVREGSPYLRRPDLQLYCTECTGIRTFGAVGNLVFLREDDTEDVFLRYTCRNCQKVEKTFAIRAANLGREDGLALKFGEFPTFGPPVPSRTISLIGPDRDLFLKGRNAENQGFGIGSYAYYRRVVENQWQRLLGEVRRVAEKVGAPAPTLEAIDRARARRRWGW